MSPCWAGIGASAAVRIRFAIAGMPGIRRAAAAAGLRW